MIIHLSSLSSFLDDGCHKWYEERGLKVALLGSLANDKSSIDRILGGEVKCCSYFMWDSGAISVRNKKTEITLDMYANWVKGIMKSDVPITIVGLDVIGDPEASQHNYLELKYKYGFGNEFLPVFHYGEDIHYLEFLIKEGFTYIGLGGVGAGDRLGQDSLRDWLRTLLFTSEGTNTLRYPGIKFHGFAMTSPRTIQGFPLHSVDSATWVKNSAIGKILTPWGDWRVSNDPRSGMDTQHIKRAAPKTVEKIRNWVESLGLNWDELPDDRYQKHIVNTNFFKWIEDNWELKAMATSTSFFRALGKEAAPEREKIKLTGFKPVEKTPEVETEEFVITELEPVFEEPFVPVVAKPLPPLFNFGSVSAKEKSVGVVSDQPVKTALRFNEAPTKNIVSPSDVVVDTIPVPKTADFGCIARTPVVCPHCHMPVLVELKVTNYAKV